MECSVVCTLRSKSRRWRSGAALRTRQRCNAANIRPYRPVTSDHGHTALALVAAGRDGNPVPTSGMAVPPRGRGRRGVHLQASQALGLVGAPTAVHVLLKATRVRVSRGRPSVRADRCGPAGTPRGSWIEGSDVLGRQRPLAHVQALPDLDRGRARLARHERRLAAGRRRGPAPPPRAWSLAYEVLYFVMLYYLRVRWVGWVPPMLCRVLCALLFLAWTAELPLEYDAYLYCGLLAQPVRAASDRCSCRFPASACSPGSCCSSASRPVCLLGPGAFGAGAAGPRRRDRGQPSRASR